MEDGVSDFAQLSYVLDSSLGLLGNLIISTNATTE